mmetsp:Transcript_11495/g.35490  ORF Transcript_11495/g.35490 Transcript_11495/m.35490 type:complete len:431 (+) Transcript_11495:71-1363(+)
MMIRPSSHPHTFATTRAWTICHSHVKGAPTSHFAPWSTSCSCRYTASVVRSSRERTVNSSARPPISPSFEWTSTAYSEPTSLAQQMHSTPMTSTLASPIFSSRRATYPAVLLASAHVTTVLRSAACIGQICPNCGVVSGCGLSISAAWSGILKLKTWEAPESASEYATWPRMCCSAAPAAAMHLRLAARWTDPPACSSAMAQRIPFACAPGGGVNASESVGGQSSVTCKWRSAEDSARRLRRSSVEPGARKGRSDSARRPSEVMGVALGPAPSTVAGISIAGLAATRLIAPPIAEPSVPPSAPPRADIGAGITGVELTAGPSISDKRSSAMLAGGGEEAGTAAAVVGGGVSSKRPPSRSTGGGAGGVAAANSGSFFFFFFSFLWLAASSSSPCFRFLCFFSLLPSSGVCACSRPAAARPCPASSLRLRAA